MSGQAFGTKSKRRIGLVVAIAGVVMLLAACQPQPARCAGLRQGAPARPHPTT